MMRRTVRSLAVLTAGAVCGVVAVAAPAQAATKSTFTSKTAGGQAYVSWTEYDLADALRLPGNTHVGFLGVYSMPGLLDVNGGIQDYECEPGEVPGGGGHLDGPGPVQPVCDLIGTRFLSRTDNTVFTIDARRGVARLTGMLRVSNGGHGEPGQTLATPAADVTWTASGATRSFRRSETWTDGTSTYRSAIRGTGFAAVVTGRLGAMGFADDTDDTSSGEVEQWQERSRQRIG